MKIKNAQTIRVFKGRQWLSMLAGVGLGVLVVPTVFPVGNGASAQTGTPQPLSDFQNPNGSSDPFSDRGGGQVDSMFNLIHRAMQGSLKSADEFNSEQRQSLEEATAEFRAKQLERLQGQPQPPDTTQPGTTPQVEK